jgi:hypothetical protein
MGYQELKVGGKVYTNQQEIIKVLKNNQFYWLIDSEIEGAIIEIKNSTIIWNGGNFYSGDWQYGIFRGGNFYGNWVNGIWESGNFAGKWQSGINLT